MQRTMMHPVLDELTDPSRRSILERLRSGEQSVMAIVQQTGLKQPNVSNHLARMRDHGVVTGKRIGRQVFYSLANPMVEAVIDTALASRCSMRSFATSREAMRDWAERYLHALLNTDESEAFMVLNECLSLHVKLEDIYVEIIEPAMLSINRSTLLLPEDIAREHAATALTERIMARASLSWQLPPSSNKAVLAAPTNDRHVLGLRMVADVLKARGWTVFYLGADVPADTLEQYVLQMRPELVLISCSLENTRLALIETVKRLLTLRKEKATPCFSIGIGGAQVNSTPELLLTSGADFTACDARQFSQYLDHLERSSQTTEL